MSSAQVASPQSPPMYVRIKRKNQTVFLHCDVNETIGVLKNRVALLMGTAASQQRLVLGRQNLEDHSTLADNGIEKDAEAVLFLLHRLDDGTGNEEMWEEVDPVLLAGGVPGAAPTSPTTAGGAGGVVDGSVPPSAPTG
eukprot:PhM_4_TR9344/c0_g1_i1/m.17389